MFLSYLKKVTFKLLKRSQKTFSLQQTFKMMMNASIHLFVEKNNQVNV